MATRDAAAHGTDYERLRSAIRGYPLPLALVDVDALEANVERLVAPARAHGKRIRVASKSVRCPGLLERIAEASGGVVTGAMAYCATECATLAEHGFDDIVIAYPTVQPSDLAAVVAVNRVGATARLMVDSIEHVDAAAQAARDAGTVLPLLVDVDVSFRPVSRVHLGVRRSPLHSVEAVLALVERIAARPELRFDGIMAYEAQIAGLQDLGLAKRALKALSRPQVVDLRAAVVDALTRRGWAPQIVNGGGTGSVDQNALEPALTEIAAGSGFLNSHLFDHYVGLALRPAAFFALQVVRRPAPGFVTCHGGGWIASGPAGSDRLPLPVAPAGLSLLDLEGAGEVQTPLHVPQGIALAVGDAVLFRHAKAGELAEHVPEYLLVSGGEVVDRVKTYRGMGQCFLG
ncbi:MAG TPA: alanine racemase [Polyangiaceae bacterium]|jgi:D-serine deaminase-like pyridoxal phosphate-dependent protein